MIRGLSTVVLRPLAGTLLLLALLAASAQAAAHWHGAGDIAEQHCSLCVLQDAPGLGSNTTTLPVAVLSDVTALPCPAAPALRGAFRPDQARAPPLRSH